MIVADAALQKGLQLAGYEQPRSRRGSQDVGGSCLKVEEKEGEEGEIPCLEELCCAAITWGDTLSSTMDKADRLKGWPLII